MHDTGKEKREPLRHRDCRVRRRLLRARAGRELEQARDEAAGPVAAQPALPSSASEPARCAGPLGRSPGLKRPRAGEPDGTLPLPTAARGRTLGVEQLPPTPVNC